MLLAFVVFFLSLPVFGTVVFRTGDIERPEDYWLFEMDEWSDHWSGGEGVFGASRENAFPLEDAGLILVVSSGDFIIQDLVPEGRGTAFLGQSNAAYSFGAATVIEHPATTIGLRLLGDPSGWQFELWGLDFSGGNESFGLLNSRTLSSDGTVEWALEEAYVSYLKIHNPIQVALEPLVVDQLYVGNFLADPVPESGPSTLLILGGGLAIRIRKRRS